MGRIRSQARSTIVADLTVGAVLVILFAGGVLADPKPKAKPQNYYDEGDYPVGGEGGDYNGEYEEYTNGYDYYEENGQNATGGTTGGAAETGAGPYEEEYVVRPLPETPEYDPYRTEPPYDPYATEAPPYDPYATGETAYDPYRTEEPPYDPYVTEEPAYDPYRTEAQPYDPYRTETPYDPYATAAPEPYDPYRYRTTTTSTTTATPPRPDLTFERDRNRSDRRGGKRGQGRREGHKRREGRMAIKTMVVEL